MVVIEGRGRLFGRTLRSCVDEIADVIPHHGAESRDGGLERVEAVRDEEVLGGMNTRVSPCTRSEWRMTGVRDAESGARGGEGRSGWGAEMTLAGALVTEL